MDQGSWMAGLHDGPMDDHEEEGDATRYSREAGAVLGAAYRRCRRGRYCVEALSRHGGLPESWNTRLPKVPRYLSGLLRVGSHGCPSSPDKKPHPGQGPGGHRSSSIRGRAYLRKKKKERGCAR
ncbi:hypothetical protein CKAH01_16277 [Colletotrichum kahawae]|uniref:Uncharacterized protein n=1 Tax=Colletotrichum kahawae TaxID=34407 RepID=A0AAD9YH47_COLKA|nr:hypothetical protein CKAH01_16277 [Colletotrichum kahawae]